MDDIERLIRGRSLALLGRISRRYGRVITSSLVGSAAFLLLFYAISDGFRESPAGLLLGLLWMLTVTGFAWRRYRQVTTFDHAAPLQEGLQALLAQRRRHLRVEQAFVVGATALALVVPRLFNGRGLPDLGQPDVALGLILMVVLPAAILLLIRRAHLGDIGALQQLLAQLNDPE